MLPPPWGCLGLLAETADECILLVAALLWPVRQPCKAAVRRDFKAGCKVSKLLRRLRADRWGVTSIEYAMIGLLIVTVIVGAVRVAGTSLNSAYGRVATSF